MTELRVPKRRILLSWSSGKDSAWALGVLRGDPRFEVVGLLTTLNENGERVAMHGVREPLLRAQARSVGLPLITVGLPEPCSNAEYEAALAVALDQAKADGVSGIAFGDLFIEDVRRYREVQVEASGLEAHFPLWGSDTRALAEEMIACGLRATLTCVNPRQIPRSFAGRAFDRALLRDLPADVDPCGENGEFHTLTTDGPDFRAPLALQRGAIVQRGDFVFADFFAPGPPTENEVPEVRATEDVL